MGVSNDRRNVESVGSSPPRRVVTMTNATPGRRRAPLRHTTEVTRTTGPICDASPSPGGQRDDERQPENVP
jgi:hypothetical protein